MGWMVVLLGAACGVGVCTVVGAFVMRKPPAEPDEPAQRWGSETPAAESSGWKGAAQRRLAKKTELVQDALMMGRSLETHAAAKLGGGVAGLCLGAMAGVFLPRFGLNLPGPGLVLVAAAVGWLGWWLPDSMLRTESDKERQYFQQVSETWLDLAGQLVTSGSDTFAALYKAASYSRQPVFVILHEAMMESSAKGEPPWVGLRNMADARRLRFMDPFCASLEMAGTTGAESRQTILSQVESTRSKSLMEADAAAASSSEKMGAPLALIGGAFMVLMGYPPLAGIMDSSTISGMSGL